MHCAGSSVDIVRVFVWWVATKQQMTTSFAWFLSRWAKLMSWEDVRKIYRVSWHTVYKAVKHAVDYGLAHRKLDDITPASTAICGVCLA